MKRTVLTPAHRNRCIGLRQSGHTVRQIADLLGVGERAMFRAFARWRDADVADVAVDEMLDETARRAAAGESQELGGDTEYVTYEDREGEERPSGNSQDAEQPRATPRFRMLEDDPESVRAAEKGELGYDPVLPGFIVKQISSAINAETGEAEKHFVKQTRSPGPEFEMPDGFRLKRISHLGDSSGRQIVKWTIAEAAAGAVDVISAMREALSEYAGVAGITPPPVDCDADLLTVYNIADAHLGLFAWAKETGEDFDLKIAEDLLLRSTRELVDSSPRSQTAILLNLGDFFHADNSRNQTEQSKNSLDVDTRYSKVLKVGANIMVALVKMALEKHQEVIVRCLPGNHDNHSSIGLSLCMDFAFQDDPRVFVDTDPSRFFKHVHGKVMLIGTHGDMLKAAELPGWTAAKFPQDWGQTKYRYGYLGHVHHKSKGGEKAGLVWETFQTLAAKDAWHAASGYMSGRSMVAITHHRERGERSRSTVNV